MSGLYQLPGLFLTALCHVIVIYYMAEHRYSGKKFFLIIRCSLQLENRERSRAMSEKVTIVKGWKKPLVKGLKRRKAAMTYT